MNYNLLRNIILNSVECSPFVITENAPYDPDFFIKDSEIAAILNRPAGTRLVERYENAIGLMSAIGSGTAAGILEKLDSIKNTIPALKWAMIAVNSDKGLNIGDHETQVLLDQLAGNGSITVTERDLVKNLAIQPSSIAWDNFGREITGADVSVALRKV